MQRLVPGLVDKLDVAHRLPRALKPHKRQGQQEGGIQPTHRNHDTQVAPQILGAHEDVVLGQRVEEEGAEREGRKLGQVCDSIGEGRVVRDGGSRQYGLSILLGKANGLGA